jgi:hypothetical protein
MHCQGKSPQEILGWLQGVGGQHLQRQLDCCWRGSVAQQPV